MVGLAVSVSDRVEHGRGWWVGRRIHASRNARNLWLGLSLGLNLGLLGYFKYANFFMASWVDAWGRLGVNVETFTLNLILPVGIRSTRSKR